MTTAIDELRRLYTEIAHDFSNTRDAMAHIKRRIAELEAAPPEPLRALLLDVASCTAPHDDERLGYVEVQIGRDELQKLRDARGGTNG